MSLLHKVLRPLASNTVIVSRRSLSFSRFLYPNATEAPEISQTQAHEVSSSSTNFTKKMTPNETDHFDDQQSFSDHERTDILKAQRDFIPQTVSCPPIAPAAPSSIPPNHPQPSAVTEQSQLTTLPNGLRVVSQETSYGQVTTVGVVSQVGSRYERPTIEAGVCHLLELLGFGTQTQKYTAPQIAELLQAWGGTQFVTTGRDQSIHCIDLLRPNVPKAVDMLEQVLLRVEYSDLEVEQAVRMMEYLAAETPPELLLTEALQTAAFHEQQLGQPHLAQPELLSNLTPSVVTQFWDRHVAQNPEGLVVAGAGMEHDELVDLVNNSAFADLRQTHTPNFVPSTYMGGECRLYHKSDKENDPDSSLVRIALALPVGGWKDDDIVVACVLQTLLGGGNSFSAGGPGKGMYSRLYRQVLNRYRWAESCEAFTAFHDEVGFWGISGSTPPHQARPMTKVLAEHIARLGVELVSEEELSRARNMLKNNVLTQLESRLVLFEDLGRQVLTYGRREEMPTTVARIDAVTAEDIQRLVQKALKSPISVAAVGEDLSNVPSHAEVARWFER